MIEAYGSNRIHFTDQNLTMNDDDEERYSNFSKDEQIRKFKTFIKEYQSNNHYIYRLVI